MESDKFGGCGEVVIKNYFGYKDVYVIWYNETIYVLNIGDLYEDEWEPDPQLCVKEGVTVAFPCEDWPDRDPMYYDEIDYNKETYYKLKAKSAKEERELKREIKFIEKLRRKERYLQNKLLRLNMIALNKLREEKGIIEGNILKLENEVREHEIQKEHIYVKDLLKLLRDADRVGLVQHKKRGSYWNNLRWDDIRIVYPNTRMTLELKPVVGEEV